MADLARIKRNVAKMAGMGAPEADIDGYIASEGVTVDDVRNFKPAAAGGAAAAQPFAVGGMSADSDAFKRMAGWASPHNQPSFGENVEALQVKIPQGITFGFADEANAGLQTVPRVIGQMLQGQPADFGKAYDEGLDFTRDYIDERAKKAPNAALAGELMGGLMTGGTLAKAGLTLMKPGASIPSAVLRGGAEGAAYGGASGFGNSESDTLLGRLDDAKEGALWGAGTGGLLAGASAASGSKKAPVPTVDELKDEARAIYKQAEASGVTFGRAEVAQTADDIAAKVISEGIDPTLHPRATAALKRLQDAGSTGMTVKDVQTMRRVLAAAAKDPMNPDEGRIARFMIDKFDDMVAGKTPDLAKAREIYRTAKKGELIETAIELAKSRASQYSQSGMENALRTEFRHLQRQIIKGQLKGLTQAEIDAINKVANGGTLDNIARYVGKAAPTGAVSFMAGGGVPFMVGNAVGGPGVGAVASGATMATGFAGKAAAEAIAKNNALKAALVARNSGAPLPKVRLTPQQAAIAQALIAAGGTQQGGGQLPMTLPNGRVSVP